jgi:cobalt-zinc-cadmium efflux system membrane fusion protein
MKDYLKNIAAALSIFLLIAGCSKKEALKQQNEPKPEAPGAITLTQEQNLSVGIQVGKVEDRALSGTIILTGMLDVPPQNLVNITAPFGGFLRATTLLQGMHVNKGAIIATIENPEYIQLQQDFLDTKSQSAFLESEYKRQEELAKENINAQKTLQRALADLNSMRAKNDGLRAKLKMLGIDADKPGPIRSTIELHSPIDGYVTQVNSAVGSFVNPTDVMFRIVDTEHLHAELIAFERDLPRIKIGQKIRLTLANETKERTAHVFLIGKEIGADRTIRIHGHLDKEDRDLIPGMYLKALVETSGQSVPSLPEQAIVNYEDKDLIFIRDPENNLVFRLMEVTTGVRENGFVEVKSPDSVMLRNASVVINGSYKLLSKMKNDETGQEPGR